MPGQVRICREIGRPAGNARRLSTEPARQGLSIEPSDAASAIETEGLEPEVLVRLLNEYLDGTCRIVLRHGGTIDKIVGDALHVMFNAPGDQPDHAERAVECALGLDEFCCRYAAGQRALGIHLGNTRIGVNTGETVVGNFGGATRFDYTAHGDAINTAARRQDAAPFPSVRRLRPLHRLFA